MPDSAQVKRIFLAALALSEGERAELLDRECAGDGELRREVEDLLTAVAGKPVLDTNPAIDAPPPSGNTTDLSPITERPGSRIGPYKLLQQIGEGGFGVVFMAEQERPVRRRVALKIIKLGMDTRRVVARFEAERQALAMMDHPHIARVLDAGATESGRPYFVMELVKGDPVTEYCDREHLTIRERLELFTQVCNAVQHAHTKGVIHRDIKPSNVLCSTQDGRPHAKIIDFGIAKATDHHLTEKTLFTEHKALIGTPAYMSPEQAEGSLDIDTRTDVYSLGVLLYELLTGTTPFDTTQLRAAAYAEMQRIIRETEPPKPSTRLSQSAETLSSLAAQRRIEPRKLGLLVRGELDWIVMKALDKDRARRYETANAFAADVGRHLTGEPVVAAPPSVDYRVRKFVRKHRGQVVGASAVAIALLLGLATALVLLDKVGEQRDVALVERQRADAKADEAEKAEKSLQLLVDDSKNGLMEIVKELVRSGMPVDVYDDTGYHCATVTIPPDADLTELDEWKFPEPKALVTTLVKNGVKGINSLVGTQASLARERDAAEWNAYIANIALAQSAMENHDWLGARERLKACPASRRGWEWEFLNESADSVLLAVPGASHGSFSRDGKRILTVSGKTVRQWATATGNRLGKEITLKNNIYSAEFSTDGARIVTLTSRPDEAWAPFAFRQWSAATADPLGVGTTFEDRVWRAVFSPDKSRIVTSSINAVRQWSVATGEALGVDIEVEGASLAKITSDGTRFLTVLGNTVRQWSAATGEQLGAEIKLEDSVMSAEFNPDGTRILTVSGNAVRQWSAATAEQLGEEIKLKDGARAAEFSSDGTRVLCLSHNVVLLMDVASDKPLTAIRPPAVVAEASLSHDGTRLLTISTQSAPQRNDNSSIATAWLWDENGRSLGMANLPPATSNGMSWGYEASFSGDDRYVMISSRSWTMVFSTDSFDSPEREISVDTELELDALFLSGTMAHVGADSDGDRVWAISPGGSRRATALDDRSVRFQETTSGRETAMFRVGSHVNRLRFTPDGTRLIVNLADKHALIWDARLASERQKDRDARFAERKPAEAWVDELLSGLIPLDQLEDKTRSDKSVSPLRRLVALPVLRDRIRTIDSDAHTVFNSITKKQISPLRCKAAANTRFELPPRVREALEKKLKEFETDYETQSRLAWETSLSGNLSPELASTVLEVAQNALRQSPDNASFELTVGVAQYRVSRFHDALPLLQKHSRDREGERLAFLAMCEFKLGNLKEATAALAKMSECSEFEIKGRTTARILRFELSSDGTEAHLVLSDDGQSFAGRIPDYDEGGWKDWTGKRKSGPPDRFDGWWSSSENDVWLTSENDRIVGCYGLEGVFLEAVALIEGTSTTSAPVRQSVASRSSAELGPTSQPVFAPTPIPGK